MDALCKRYKIDNSKREKHTALIDCELLSKVYINLTGQKEPSLDLKVGETPIQSNHDHAKVKYFKKIIKPTDQDLNLHKKYLKTHLKKNFFN